jgi:hypothetical protein
MGRGKNILGRGLALRLYPQEKQAIVARKTKESQDVKC